MTQISINNLALALWFGSGAALTILWATLWIKVYFWRMRRAGCTAKIDMSFVFICALLFCAGPITLIALYLELHDMNDFLDRIGETQKANDDRQTTKASVAKLRQKFLQTCQTQIHRTEG